MKWLQALVAISCLGFVAYLVVAQTRRFDSDDADRYDDDLQSLSALNYRLIGEVLKARSGSVSHYDGLVQTEAALTRLHDRLHMLPNVLRGDSARDVLAAVDHSRQLFEHTRSLIETFKSDNAVLRNSLRYLTVLATEIKAADTHAPDQGLLPDAFDALVRDSLLLQGWHEQSILERVATEAETLTAAVEKTPSSERGQLDAAVAHVRLVRERTTAVSNLTRSIVEQPTLAAAKVLSERFARYHRGAVAQAALDRTVVFALCMLALLSSAAMGIARLTRTARALRAATDQLTQANAALQAEHTRQQELNALTSRFVSMTSHEFRTPLSTIMSSNDMLAAYTERWSPEKRQEHFARIRTAVLGMTQMLDGLLMIGRSEAGMLTFNPRSTDLVRICARALEGASAISRAEHEIVYDGPHSAERAYADEALVTNILDNLLSNALKYSPKGGRVTLSLIRNNGVATFEVRDQGIGIPNGDHGRLFDTFQRGSNAGGIAGSGLGLAVVKRAVQLHGGTVSLRSEVNQGTTFCVRLPCTEPSTHAETA